MPLRLPAGLRQRLLLAVALEIPPGFAPDVERGRPVGIGAWFDGAMPMHADTVRGYVQGMHVHWLTEQLRQIYGDDAVVGSYSLEMRYRYNPDVESLAAMVPAVIPLLLMLIPAMFAFALRRFRNFLR